MALLKDQHKLEESKNLAITTEDEVRKKEGINEKIWFNKISNTYKAVWSLGEIVKWAVGKKCLFEM